MPAIYRVATEEMVAMKMKEKDAVSLAALLLSHDKQMEMHRNLFLSPICENPDIVDFTNARDYFLVGVVDILSGKNIEEATKLMPTIEALLGLSGKVNDKFYEGFFFALHEIIGYGLDMDDGSGHKMNRDLLKASVKTTLNKIYGYRNIIND